MGELGSRCHGGQITRGYRPIGDYGVIGDCQTAALISGNGSIDWCCFPNFDSPSFFGRLLDVEGGGFFAVHPVGSYQYRQAYIEGTNLLETIYQTPTGSVRLIDFMPIPSAETRKRHLFPLRQILRHVEGISGSVEMEIEYAPRPAYGLGNYRLEARSPYCLVMSGKGWLLSLASESPLQLDRTDAYGRFCIEAGKHVTLGVSYEEEGPGVFPSIGASAELLLQETSDFWEGWLGRCSYDGPYLPAVQRTALALKLLDFAPSGAIVAAPTTSLPEK